MATMRSVATSSVRRQWRAVAVPMREMKADIQRAPGDGVLIAVSAGNPNDCNIATIANLQIAQIATIAAAMSGGLRERKKQQTRQAIHEAAMRLFAERGFEATTIADIAAAADIAPRTFFAYFPSKEEAVFPKYEAAFEQFDRLLDERPTDTTALDVLRQWVE